MLIALRVDVQPVVVENLDFIVTIGWWGPILTMMMTTVTRVCHLSKLWIPKKN